MINLPQTLISPSEVISIAFLSRDNLSSDSVRQILITIAEERYIRPRFGNDLYNEFFNSTYEDFVNDYIKPPLAHFVRSAMIEDLAIMVNDDGIKMFSSLSQDTNTEESSEQTTATNSGSNSTVVASDKIVSENGTENEVVNTDCQDETSTMPLNTDGTTSATTVDEQVVTEVTTTGKTTTDLDQSTTENSTTEKSESSTSEENSTKSQETLRAADFLERRVLISQSFNDANTLLGRAVRYVEEHPDEFPDYNPKRTIFRRFF